MWENSLYVSPAKYRQQLGAAAKNKYVNRIQQKVQAELNRPQEAYKLKPMEDIFKGKSLEKAYELTK